MISFLINTIKVLFLLGFLIFIHEGGHFVVAKLCKVKVKEFAIGFGPVLLRKKKNETRYVLRLIPIGGFVSMEGEDEESDEEGSFSKISITKKILIIIAGALVNIVIGILIYFTLSSNSGVNISNKVESVKNANIEVVEQIQVGDRIIKINGKDVRNIRDIYKQLNKVKEPLANIVVERNNEIIQFNVDLEKDEETGQYYIGITLEQVPNSFANNIYYGFWNTVDFSVSIFDNLKLLFTGKIQANNLMGPVGISNVVSKSDGLKDYIYLIALISVSLGITNLIPIPPLDGGKILFLIIEGIRKKPIKKELEYSIQLVGFTLLIMLSLFVMYNDIIRIVK